MLNALARPLLPAQAMAAGVAVVGGGALYCVGYTFFAGRYEDPLEAAAWASANLLPWLAAFELAKRAPSRMMIALILAAAAFASLLLEAAFGLISASQDVAFQLLRRLPGAGLVLLLLLIGRIVPAPPGASCRGGAAATLPLLPHQIDWIGAAGNYLEIHSGGAMAMQRMTMAQAEAELAGHGFVRIHRSTLVNAARVAAIRRGKQLDEVELADGRRLKAGDAYRSRLVLLERRLAA